MSLLSRVIVAGLAGERLRRAWQDEVIGEPLRKLIGQWATTSPITDDPKADRRAAATRDFVYELTGCPHCLGFWLTLAAAVGLRTRIARPIIEALAGAVILSAFVHHYHDGTQPAV